MTQKVAIITGASSGIGKETAVAMARDGFKVFLACRSPSRTAPVLAEINASVPAERNAELLHLDLASMSSVRKCADEFLRRDLPLQVLVNNAGIVARGLTEEGFELIFGVNHLGHFLLTMLLLDKLKQSAPSRIVNVSSRSHFDAKAMDLSTVRRSTRSITGLPEYQVSKLANVLFTRELARRLAGTGVTSYAIHPGKVATNAFRRVPAPVLWLMKKFMITPEEGAMGVIRAACSEAAAAEDGLYYDQLRPVPPSVLAQDDELAATLWRDSVRWTGVSEEAPS